MKNIFYLSLLILFLFSCKVDKDQITELNEFLKVNYDFNNRILNKHKGIYYLIASEQSSRNIDKLNELDSKYELFISKIDKTILNKETTTDEIILEYKDILTIISEIVNRNNDYLIPELNFKNSSKEFLVNNIKNRLAIAMSYAFEYASLTTPFCGLRKLDHIDTTIENNNNTIKITLSSEIAQMDKKNRQVLINSIAHNGKNKNINYSLLENYSFANIFLNALDQGDYKVNGVVRYYNRDGKIDIPFEEEFEVK